MSEVFTYERLVAIAEQAYQIYKFGNDIEKPGSQTQYKRYENATFCAEHMKKNKITHIKHIGPFGTHNLKIGNLVKIKSGSEIHTDNPKYRLRGNSFISNRVHKIHVYGWSDGYISQHKKDYGSVESQPKETMISWRDPSGYIYWTSINNLSD